jgi:Flp pilus assembly protein TadG
MKPDSCIKKATGKRRRQAGQNLVELTMTLPFVLLLIFFLIEVVRVSFTYQSTSIAARQGAEFAAVYHSTAMGLQQMKRTLAASGMTASTTTVTQVANTHGYEASVTVKYAPLFTMSIPLMGGSNTNVSPGSFDIAFTAVPDSGLY